MQLPFTACIWGGETAHGLVEVASLKDPPSDHSSHLFWVRARKLARAGIPGVEYFLCHWEHTLSLDIKTYPGEWIVIECLNEALKLQRALVKVHDLKGSI